MSTLPLRELLRRPTLVKQITTRVGSVRVVIPDAGELPENGEGEAVRSEWIEGYFDELMTALTAP